MPKIISIILGFFFEWIAVIFALYNEICVMGMGWLVYCRCKALILSSLLRCLGLGLLWSCAFGQGGGGRDFWLTFQPNRGTDDDAQRARYLQVRISARTQAAGRLFNPRTGWSTDFVCPANSSITLAVPDEQGYTNGSNVRQNTGLRITATANITVTALNFLEGFTDAAGLIPYPQLGKEYYILTTNQTSFPQRPSTLTVVATAANTEVEITATAPPLNAGTITPGVPFTITLGEGEVYQLQSTGDLTGSRIRVLNNDCRSIAVFGGTAWTYVGDNCMLGGHLFEQMPPVNAWRRSYAVVPFLTRRDYRLRVLASETQTTLRVNGQVVGRLEPGRVFQLPNDPTDALFIQADKPILVAQFAKGFNCDNVRFGDPFMVLVPPVNGMMQFKRLVLNDLAIPTFDKGYANLITRTHNTQTFALDGRPLGNVFRPLPGNPQLSYAQLTLQPGDRLLTSDSAFTILQYGMGPIDGYGFAPAGNYTTPSPTIRAFIGQDSTHSASCVGTRIRFVAGGGFRPKSYTWRVNQTTVQKIHPDNAFEHTFTEPGTNRIFLQLESEDRCFSDTVSLVYTALAPQLRITNLIHANCKTGARGSFTVSAQNGLPPYRYSLDNAPFSEVRLFENRPPGNYTVRVRDAAGCMASLTVVVEQGGDLDFSPNIQMKATCTGERDVTITVNGAPAGTRFSFNGIPFSQTQRFPNLKPGNYMLMAQLGDCQKSITVTVEPVMPLRGSIVQRIGSDCSGRSGTGRMIAEATGGQSPYRFSIQPLGTVNSTGEFTNLPAGDWMLVVTDANGCTTTPLPFTIASIPELSLALQTTINPGCSNRGGQILMATIGGVPPYRYAWSDNPNRTTETAQDLPAGVYAVTVTDVRGCTDVYPKVVLSVTDGIEAGPDLAVCYNSQLQVGQGLSQPITPVGWRPTGGRWQAFNTVTRQPLTLNPQTGAIDSVPPAGTYTLVYAHDGCQDSLRLTVLHVKRPFSALTLCSHNPPVTLPASGGRWRGIGVSNTSPQYFDPKQTGVGTFQLVYQEGDCGDSVQVVVQRSPKANFNLTQAQADLRFVNLAFGYDSLRWVLGDGQTVLGELSEYTYRRPGTFRISQIVTTRAGCADTMTQTVVIPPIRTFQIPTVFRLSGVNGVWVVETSLFVGYRAHIYNRWGELIFESAGTGDLAWDGRTNARQQVPEGVYIYQLELVDEKSSVFIETGTVTVLH